MSLPIGPIALSRWRNPPFPPPAGTPAPGEFGALLDKAISRGRAVAPASQQKKRERLLSGKPEELHSVVLTTQRAQLEFELFLEVRNKVVQAYQEIMRMQV